MATPSNTNDGGARNTKERAPNRSRNWSLTINNYDTAVVELLKNLPTKSIAFQSEKGKNGTPHIQASLSFSNARTFASMKRLFPRAHIERTRNVLASESYCTKADTWDGLYRYKKVGKDIIIDVYGGVEAREESIDNKNKFGTQEWYEYQTERYLTWLFSNEQLKMRQNLK